MRTLIISHCGAALIALLVCAGASAAERRPNSVGAPERSAYRYFDEKGNVIYSELPPPAGTRSQKVDITPARAARPSYPPRARPEDAREQSAEKKRRQERIEEEEKERRRLAELEAECRRKGGRDCKNAEVLRTIEAGRAPDARQ